MSGVKNYYHEKLIKDLTTKYRDLPNEERTAIYEATGGGEPYGEAIRRAETIYIETGVDFFPDRRIDYTGYEEFDCPLCGRPNDRDALHAACEIEERERGEAIDEYYWERSAW